MVWAFGTGVIFGGLGEFSAGSITRSARRNWGIANDEYMKHMNSIGMPKHDKWMRSFHARQARIQERMFGFTHQVRRHYEVASRYPIRSVYKPDPNNLSSFAQTTIWAVGVFVGDNEYIGLFQNQLPQLIYDPHTLIER